MTMCVGQSLITGSANSGTRSLLLLLVSVSLSGTQRKSTEARQVEVSVESRRASSARRENCALCTNVSKSAPWYTVSPLSVLLSPAHMNDKSVVFIIINNNVMPCCCCGGVLLFVEETNGSRRGKQPCCTA